MEEQKVKAGSVAVGICLFVIAILLVLIVVFFYNTTMEKNKLQAQIDELETEIEEKDEVSNNSDESNKIEDIILEGDYAIENSDFGYRFYKDGRVEAIGNVEITEGTYYTIGENKIELKFTKRTIDEPEWDEPIVENINEIDKATIKDENTLIIEGEANGEKYEYEIVKYIKNNEEIEDEIDNFNNLKADKVDDIKYEITTRNNEYDEEMYAIIKATKDGKTITKELNMYSLIDDTGIMSFPIIGNVAIVAVSGGEGYSVCMYQLIDGDIKELGTIECGIDMVPEATYEATKKDETTVVITAKRDSEEITKEFKMDAEISKIEIIEVPKCGKVVVVAEKLGEYYKFKVFRLSQNYIDGKTEGIVEVGVIQ